MLAHLFEHLFLDILPLQGSFELTMIQTSQQKIQMFKKKKNNNKKNWNWPLCLLFLGMSWLNGCETVETLCPPFPKPHPKMAEEITQKCSLTEMPYFKDWLNRLYRLERQLEL